MAITKTVKNLQFVDEDPQDGLNDALIILLEAKDSVNQNKVSYFERKIDITPTSGPAITQAFVDTQVSNLLASVHDPVLDATKTVDTWMDEQVNAWTSAPSIIDSDYSSLPAI